MAKEQVGEVKLQGVRLSFADIWKARTFRGDDDESPPRFSANFLIDRSTPAGAGNDKAVKRAIKEVAAAKWGANIPKIKPDRFCYRDGDQETYDGYAGMWYVSAASKRRPIIVDRQRRPLAEEDGRPYAGCYVNAIVRIWAQDDRQFGKRINCSLEAIQFVEDGEAFGAPPVDPDAAFEDLDGGGAESAGNSFEDTDGDDLL